MAVFDTAVPWLKALSLGLGAGHPLEPEQRAQPLQELCQRRPKRPIERCARGVTGAGARLIDCPPRTSFHVLQIFLQAPATMNPLMLF